MIRVAMFSGPRNLSTALMRSFEARGDCHVVDEPLYGAYLAQTGLDHPGRDAILTSLPTDYSAALAALQTGPAELQYEKHMAHHLADDDPLDWLQQVRPALLIRDPRAVLASYARVRETPAPEELGFLHQIRVLDAVPDVPIVDSASILRDPEGTLAWLCGELEIPWTPRMLSWEAGSRATDGVWARFWYRSVHESKGFGPPTEGIPEVPPHLRPVLDALWPAWERLSSRAR